MTDEAFVPIEKLATHFCVTVHTIRSWVRQGHIPRNAYIKAGNTYRFSVPRVMEALTGGNIESPEPETTDPVQVDNAELTVEPVQLELNFSDDEDI
jgi:hypothetical protein